MGSPSRNMESAELLGGAGVAVPVWTWRWRQGRRFEASNDVAPSLGVEGGCGETQREQFQSKPGRIGMGPRRLVRKMVKMRMYADITHLDPSVPPKTT
jgi:hypothetical protein